MVETVLTDEVTGFRIFLFWETGVVEGTPPPSPMASQNRENIRGEGRKSAQNRLPTGLRGKIVSAWELARRFALDPVQTFMANVARDLLESNHASNCEDYALTDQRADSIRQALLPAAPTPLLSALTVAR